jgi:C4-dicarboxylate-specific signal transduction histidine kinase
MVIGALTLGRKGSGRSYEDDLRFLTAAASQIGPRSRACLRGARRPDVGSRIGARPDRRPGGRQSRSRALVERWSAFQQLEQSQTSLMRADRLATLGRLTAGIAHEVNTPLGAVLNALQILGDLGQGIRTRSTTRP